MGKILTVPPPVTVPADPPWQTGWRATSELEFPLPASLAATAEGITAASVCPPMRAKNGGGGSGVITAGWVWPKMREKNVGCVSWMITCTLPGEPAYGPLTGGA